MINSGLSSWSKRTDCSALRPPSTLHAIAAKVRQIFKSEQFLRRYIFLPVLWNRRSCSINLHRGIVLSIFRSFSLRRSAKPAVATNVLQMFKATVCNVSQKIHSSSYPEKFSILQHLSPQKSHPFSSCVHRSFSPQTSNYFQAETNHFMVYEIVKHDATISPTHEKNVFYQSYFIWSSSCFGSIQLFGSLVLFCHVKIVGVFVELHGKISLKP